MGYVKSVGLGFREIGVKVKLLYLYSSNTGYVRYCFVGKARILEESQRNA
jgi:hypothetical protein